MSAREYFAANPGSALDWMNSKQPLDQFIASRTATPIQPAAPGLPAAVQAPVIARAMSPDEWARHNPFRWQTDPVGVGDSGDYQAGPDANWQSWDRGLLSQQMQDAQERIDLFESGNGPFGYDQATGIDQDNEGPSALSQDRTVIEGAQYKLGRLDEYDQWQAQRDAVGADLREKAGTVLDQLGTIEAVIQENTGQNIYQNDAKDSLFHKRAMASRLHNAGITDLRQIEARDGKFYDRQTGTELNSEIGYSTAGNGMTRYRLRDVDDGNGGSMVIPVAEWSDTSDAGTVITVLAVALAFTGAGAVLGTAMMSGTAAAGAVAAGTASATLGATAIGNAALAGGLTALAGGDGKDVLRNAGLAGVTTYAGGKVGQALGGAKDAGVATNALAGAGSGATRGLIASAINGGSPLAAAGYGAVTGGVSGTANTVLPRPAASAVGNSFNEWLRRRRNG